jgi:hypothetical protein
MTSAGTLVNSASDWVFELRYPPLPLPYTVHPVDVFGEEQFKPEFLELNPNVKVPLITTAVRFSFSLQLHAGATDIWTTLGSPWPDLFRPPTSSKGARSAGGKV